MPSPFPGMDPYLERGRYFPDFHNSFLIFLKAALQELLPGRYYARTEERIWIEWPRHCAIPDVSVSRAEWAATPATRGDTATLQAIDLDTELVELAEGEEVREIYLEVLIGDPGEQGRLVTAIELLSPSNKAAGSEGREAYLRKQGELLARDVHLIEIDLLRGGAHTTAVPRGQLTRPFDYHVAVRDRNLPPTRMYSYPILLENKLPRIAVPLLTGAGCVTVDLQPVFDRCYDTGSYRREIDYRTDPVDPPLPEPQRAWAAERVEHWLASATT